MPAIGEDLDDAAIFVIYSGGRGVKGLGLGPHTAKQQVPDHEVIAIIWPAEGPRGWQELLGQDAGLRPIAVDVDEIP